jgi:hypothetical protein
VVANTIGHKTLSCALALLLMATAVLMAHGFTQQAYAAGDIAITAANFPDDNFRNQISVSYDTNHDGVLTTEEIQSVTAINVTNKHISSLKGIEHFTALENLQCS